MNLLDLPDEILLSIFKKLDNMDVLYSMFDVDQQRLNNLLQENIFTNTLNFISTTTDDDISSLPDRIVNRFCKNILPKIDQNIQFLILDSLSMENILQAGNYSNLSRMKLFNFNDKIVETYFKVQSSFQHIFQQQITDLILVFEKNFNQIIVKHYSNDIYAYILQSFKNLKYLSLNGSYPNYYPPLTFKNLSFNDFSSLILSKLSVRVLCYEDCLALLDGRLKQLNSLDIVIFDMQHYSSNLYPMDNLVNMEYFSFKCICLSNEYEREILLLFSRMINLKELTLYMIIDGRNKFIDGNDINNEILIHMTQLNRLNFCISSTIRINNLNVHLFKDDIQQTFTNALFKKVECIINNRYHVVTCHVFSLPFMLNKLQYIGNIFPSIIFNHVKILLIQDVIPFKHEFFIRLAWSFPLLEQLCVFNLKSQTLLLDNSNNYNAIVKYSHLMKLDIRDVHIDYIDQFLNYTKTCLPSLIELTVDYNLLKYVTEDFTRNETRFNCRNVKKINMTEKNIQSKDFFVYFPLL